MASPVELSVIITSFNTKKYLKNCLDALFASVKASRITTEVIVIDNGSTDGSREMLVEEYPMVRRIFKRKNIGFGPANNIGIKEAVGEYILLLNSDAFVVEDGIERMLQYARRHPKAFIGAKLFNRDGTPQASCGPFYSIPVVFVMLFLKGDALKITRYSPDKPRRVDWVSGACLMAQKKVFEDGLLFDENIFMYMDEIDLLYRAKMKGYRTYFFPSAKFIHVGSGSSIGRKQPVLNIYHGLVYFYRKHYGGLAFIMLKVLLRLKAAVAVSIGALTGNSYLQETYNEAYKLV